MIRQVLFDMDGVIMDSMPAHTRSWMKVFREEGILPDRMDILKREGMSAAESIRQIFAEKGLGDPSEEQIRGLTARKQAYFAQERPVPFPYVVQILELLRSRNTVMALVTGSGRAAAEHILPPEISGFFSCIITSDDVKECKPSPEPWLAAAGVLGAGPDTCFAVENAPLGIASVRAAGFYCIALETSLPASFLSGADRILGSHRELYGLLSSSPDSLF